jgi:cysteinyl-tRNA synthetase
MANTEAAAALPQIEVYSTLTKKKAPLTTVTPGHVGMYLCGPTVYKPSHIGHMVGPVISNTRAGR